MARYFMAHETRGKALAKVLEDARRNPDEVQTVYVVQQTRPPLFLSGPFTEDMEVAGAAPLMSITSHAPPLFHAAGESMRCWHDLEDEVAK